MGVKKLIVEKNLFESDEEELDIKATDVFFKNLNSDKPIVINRGGASSSKSHSMMQLLLYMFFTGEKLKILILRKTLPSLRHSVYMLMKEMASSFGLWDRVVEEKVYMNWFFGGNLIHFSSVDDPEKLKSTEWNVIWLEEATEFTYDDFQIIRLRLRGTRTDKKKNQIFLSFNPIDEFHWIKLKLLDDPTMSKDCEEIVSTYRDNPFSDPDYVKVLEGLQEQDISYYNVYAQGNWGKLENIIYNNWEITDWWPDVSSVESVFYGIDFGYNEQTALVEMRKKGRDVWEKELLYHTKLTNADLILKLQDVIPLDSRRFTIWADSAEPDRIEEIKRAGFRIKPAIKLVTNGIDAVKRMKCHVLSESINLIKELRGYSWRKDKNNNVLDEPIGFRDHLMDAKRYGIYMQTKGNADRFRVRYI